MNFRVSELSLQSTYKMLAALVVPRPIAFVTTLSADGVPNAAPFSFFNMLGSDPPMLGIGIAHRTSGIEKDTLTNIEATGEFVVHLVDEDLIEQMNICAIDFPPGVDELSQANLSTRQANLVAPPVIDSAQVHIECILDQVIRTGNNHIILGKIVAFTIADKYLQISNLRVDTPSLKLVGRMHGDGWYAKTSDLFNLDRIPYADWLSCHEEPPPSE
jgi:flavin reductase (DIM6/NTAB) family NADH-FMN oxidoreductase RutF